MFHFAIARGHRPEVAGSPCSSITRYRRPPRGRLLGADDRTELGTTLRRLKGECPFCVAAVRLSLLSGCRPGEIRRLRWCEVEADRLALKDPKTGPRDVLLYDAARESLNGLPGTAFREWGFPGESGDEPLDKNTLYWFWTKARDMAGIVEDARLLDVRNFRASHAVVNGEGVHIAGRRFGHWCASTTNRCVHPEDATLSEAAERVAVAL